MAWFKGNVSIKFETVEAAAILNEYGISYPQPPFVCVTYIEGFPGLGTLKKMNLLHTEKAKPRHGIDGEGKCWKSIKCMRKPIQSSEQAHVRHELTMITIRDDTEEGSVTCQLSDSFELSERVDLAEDRPSITYSSVTRHDFAEESKVMPSIPIDEGTSPVVKKFRFDESQNTVRKIERVKKSVSSNKPPTHQPRTPATKCVALNEEGIEDLKDYCIPPDLWKTMLKAHKKTGKGQKRYCKKSLEEIKFKTNKKRGERDNRGINIGFCSPCSFNSALGL